MAAPREKQEYSEIHLARIYLLMASCCAMPLPRRPLLPACSLFLPRAFAILPAILTLMHGVIDDGDTYECGIMVCNRVVLH